MLEVLLPLLLLPGWLAVYRLRELVARIPKVIGFAAYERVAIGNYNPRGVRRCALERKR